MFGGKLNEVIQAMHLASYLAQKGSAWRIQRSLTCAVGGVEVRVSVHINKDDSSFSSGCRLQALFAEPLALFSLIILLLRFLHGWLFNTTMNDLPPLVTRIP